MELLQDSASTPGPPYDAEMGVSRPGQAIHLSTGFDVNYVAQGDHLGVPVLLLHAWGESLGCFDRLMPLLATTIRVLAMDQRGHVHSGKPADAYSLSDVGGDVTAFLDAMGLADAVMVGSSSGGYLAADPERPHRGDPSHRDRNHPHPRADHLGETR